MKFFDNPWGMAEKAVYTRLCTAAGATDQKNAFLGFIPPAPNVWGFSVGGGGDVRNTWTAPITEIQMDALIEGIFLDRSKAQLVALSILKILPIKRVENVQCFRLKLGGQPDIKITEVTFANETAPKYVWNLSIGFEIVFNTVERANVEPVT